MAASSQRVVFMGTPQLSADFLTTGLAKYPDVFSNIAAVFTQPDRPAGRGRHLAFSPVKQWAIAQNLPVFQPQSLKSPEAQACLRDIQPAYIWVVAYGLLLPPPILALAPCWNAHFSLLPRYRGASPIQQAILHGDQETGVTMMRMDAGLDTGPILGQDTLALPDSWGADRLATSLTSMAVDVLAKVWDKRDKIQETDQNSVGIPSSIAPKLSKKDAQLHADQETAITLQRKVLAFKGNLSAWFDYQGMPIKVHTAHCSSEPSDGPRDPGVVLRCDATGLWVQTTAGVWVMDQIQFPGRKPQYAREWVQGRHPFTVGAPLVD